MSRRYLLFGLAVLALAAALAIPAVAQPGGGPGCWGFGAGTPSATVPGTVTLDAAVQRVKDVLAASGYGDLRPKEVMEFSNHFYVLVVEKGTGKGAMELIVERNGVVRPEPGPNMMWNLKYGHMGSSGFGPGMMGPGMTGPGMMGPGMMGPGAYGPGYGPGFAPGAEQAPLTRERARQVAQEFLSRAFPGATPDHGTEFYGYFTFDAERNGKTFGMLSVNAYTGQVWYHTWHGQFVREKEL